MNKKKIYDLIIIGSGPAGMTAAVYASKAKLKTLLIEASFPGGKVVNTSFVENWPGEKRIEGYELANQMFEHAVEYGAEFTSGKVVKVEDEGKIKKVICENASHETYAVIIATGTKERQLGIPGEDEFYGKGISYCAVCDGSLYKDKTMVVVGGGNSALQEALYLTNFSDDIYLINWTEEFNAEEKLIEEIKNNKSINLVLNSEVIKVNGDSVVTDVDVKNNLTNEVSNIKTSVMFTFIGANPVVDFIYHLNLLTEYGYLKVNDAMETSIPGIYGAGDVNCKQLRQIVTAVSDGSIAATQAYHYIKSIKK